MNNFFELIMEISTFDPFVLPFLFGTIMMFGILLYKFGKWLVKMSRRQWLTVIGKLISFNTLKAVWEAIRECLFHRNIFKTNPILGYMHFSFAFGWLMLILVGKLEEIAATGKIFTEPWGGIFFKYFYYDLPHYPFEKFFLFVMDILLIFVLSGLILAFIKRVRSRWLGMRKTTNHSWIDRIALTALWFIFPFRLLAECASAGVKQNGGFITQPIGDLLSVLPIEYIELPLWWVYSFALGVFFVYMPFTRYMHIFTEVLLIFLRKWGVVEEDTYTGYTHIEMNACSRCGICIDACQLNTALENDKIQPVYMIRDIRGKKIEEETINNCLMCNRCVQACPVGIESTRIRRIYRHKKEFDKKEYYDFLSTEPTKPSESVLYFAGCMSHLTPSITDSMRKIFESASQPYLFLDEEQNICCGKPLKQQGFLEQAKTLKKKNTSLINHYQAEILVTSCPICYNSFKQDYNLKIKVVHHTEYIESLIDSGRISIDKSAMNFVYHDPCEISRGYNIYNAPRNILKLTGTLDCHDAEKEKTLCCGGSLANTILTPEQFGKVRDEALETLTNSNPDAVITSCPLCKKSFQKGKTKNIKILDIAEIVAQQLSDR